jgi:hypothetical protein
MQTFETGPEVYGHMTEQHNGDCGLPMDGDAEYEGGGEDENEYDQ